MADKDNGNLKLLNHSHFFFLILLFLLLIILGLLYLLESNQKPAFTVKNKREIFRSKEQYLLAIKEAASKLLVYTFKTILLG